jgi:hypothetical protein
MDHLREYFTRGQERKEGAPEGVDLQYRLYYGLLYHALGQSPEDGS